MESFGEAVLLGVQDELDCLDLAGDAVREQVIGEVRLSSSCQGIVALAVCPRTDLRLVEEVDALGVNRTVRSLVGGRHLAAQDADALEVAHGVADAS
eukprot:10389677-Heterocapsa_arctica.AAC.1